LLKPECESCPSQGPGNARHEGNMVPVDTGYAKAGLIPTATGLGLSRERGFVCLALLDGLLFAVGGHDKKSPFVRADLHLRRAQNGHLTENALAICSANDAERGADL